MSATDITPFAFGENLVRVQLDENGNPWFVAKDVCNVLEIENVGNVLAALDDDEKITIHSVDGNPRAGIPHQFTLIAESGLYSLIFRSRKPEAKAFRKWVTADVLPTLRRTGRYALPTAEAEAPKALHAGTDFLHDLPTDVLFLPSRTRDRAMNYALQMARITGGGGSDYVRDIFVQCCRIISGGRGSGQGNPSPNQGDADARTLELVRAFTAEACVPAAGSRLRCMKLYTAFVHWCEQNKHLNEAGIPSCIRFSRSLEYIQGVKKVSSNPYSVFAGLRFA